MKQQGDELTNRQNGKKMNTTWQVGKMTSKPHDKLTKWQVDSITSRQNEMHTKWQVDFTISDKKTKWQADKMTSRQNDKKD